MMAADAGRLLMSSLLLGNWVIFYCRAQIYQPVHVFMETRIYCRLPGNIITVSLTITIKEKLFLSSI
jgi:hypothetical protein